MARRHPTLEGLRHSLDWIWQRIEPIVLNGDDRELLLKWLGDLTAKVERKDADD